MSATLDTPGRGDPRIDATRRPLEQARHAPGYIYDSPEVFALEKQKIFMADWLCIGRVEEFEKPGQYRTYRIFDEPVLVVRDQTGALKAFSNTCVHRGVEVVQGSGTLQRFTCPYHAWVYDLDGRLEIAPYMEEAEGFAPHECGLPRLRLEEWVGNVFITFNDAAPPLNEFIAEFANDFAPLHQERCRMGNRIELELDCNWKFVSENLMDFYHVRVVHAGSFGAKFAWDDSNVHTKPGGGLTIWYDAASPVPGGKSPFGMMPWIADKPESFACTGFMAPNFTLFGRCDCVRNMFVWPLAPNKCHVVVYHLFPEEWFERPDFEEQMKVYYDYQLVVLEEDRSMIHSLQRAMSARDMKPGPMSKFERPIYNYINGHLDRLYGPEQAATGQAAGD